MITEKTSSLWDWQSKFGKVDGTSMKQAKSAMFYNPALEKLIPDELASMKTDGSREKFSSTQNVSGHSSTVKHDERNWKERSIFDLSRQSMSPKSSHFPKANSMTSGLEDNLTLRQTEDYSQTRGSTARKHLETGAKPNGNLHRNDMFSNCETSVSKEKVESEGNTD